MREDLQKRAQIALETNYTPPQRYGTAFHVTPPVLDLRELQPAGSPRHQDFSALSDSQYDQMAEAMPHDPYLTWQLAHSPNIDTRLIHIKPGQSASINITGPGLCLVILEENAQLILHDAIEQESMSVKRYFIWQKAGSSFEFMGVRTRNHFLNESMRVHLAGRSSNTKITHLTYGASDEQSDIAVSVYHQAPDTKTDMLVRTAAAQKHQAIYHGLIDVGAGAAGTNGYQQGNALSLSPRAVIDALPHLEIRTDDVRCTHGVTTTHLDDTALFYLRSRGLDEATARMMAIKGFFHHKLTLPTALADVLHASIESHGSLS